MICLCIRVSVVLVLETSISVVYILPTVLHMVVSIQMILPV